MLYFGWDWASETQPSGISRGTLTAIACGGVALVVGGWLWLANNNPTRGDEASEKVRATTTSSTTTSVSSSTTASVPVPVDLARVPNVVGMSRDHALSVLSEAGFKPSVRKAADPGMVVAVDSQPDGRWPLGSRIEFDMIETTLPHTQCGPIFLVPEPRPPTDEEYQILEQGSEYDPLEADNFDWWVQFASDQLVFVHGLSKTTDQNVYATLANPEGPDLGWEVLGTGSCEIGPLAGNHRADVFLETGNEPLPTDTEIEFSFVESTDTCDGGGAVAHGRPVEPVVVETDNYVILGVFVELPIYRTTCAANSSFGARVQLKDPLGNRTILSLGPIPAEPAPTYSADDYSLNEYGRVEPGNQVAGQISAE